MQTATDLEFSPFSSESPYYHKQIASNFHLDPVEMQTDTVKSVLLLFYRRLDAPWFPSSKQPVQRQRDHGSICRSRNNFVSAAVSNRCFP